MNQIEAGIVAKDEISVKELVLTLFSIVKVFYDNILLITFCGLLGSCISFYFAFVDKPIYRAETNFIIAEGTPAGLNGTLGNLGSLLTGSTGSSLDRTVAVIGSERLISNVLLSCLSLNGQNERVINHFIRLQGLSQKWQGDSVLCKARFKFIDTLPELYNKSQRAAYKIILASFVDGGILERSFDKKTGIISFSISFRDEGFAIGFSELLFNHLKDYIKSQATEPANLNSLVLSKKVDSIQAALSVVRKQIARRLDQSTGLLLNEDKVDLKTLSVKEQVLLTMYGEAQKNLETVLFMAQSASNATKVILLERPFAPLTPTSKSKILYSIFGFLFSSIFMFSIILVIRWYKSLFNN
jgi:hypothetical protein